MAVEHKRETGQVSKKMLQTHVAQIEIDPPLYIGTVPKVSTMSLIGRSKHISVKVCMSNRLTSCHFFVPLHKIG